MHSNQTFRGAEPTWANACVGDNGNPQIFHYASGFAAAAKTLLECVIASEGIGLTVDTLIYPICFNMRHAVELFLKSTVSHLQTLATIREVRVPSFDMNRTHHLGTIWSYVKDNAVALDVRYNVPVAQLDEYIEDIAKIDATGQVFRYPFDVEQKKHLVDVAVINVVVLLDRFKDLEQRLIDLDRLNTNLIEEYGWGSFTARLSRAQLIEIALTLPPRSRWQEANFTDVKTALRAKYSLSSGEFSRALCVIQKRYEMAALIGVQLDIRGLSAFVLETFGDIWVKAHGLDGVKRQHSNEIVPSGDININVAEAYYENHTRCCTALVEALRPEALASLRSLYYFAREMHYSEVFDSYMEDHMRDAGRHESSPQMYYRDAQSLLQKTDGLVSVLNSLNFLGQIEYRDLLIARYHLNDVSDRVLESSERRKKMAGLQ